IPTGLAEWNRGSLNGVPNLFHGCNSLAECCVKHSYKLKSVPFGLSAHGGNQSVGGVCGVRKPEAERYRPRSAFTVCSQACLDTAPQQKARTLHDPRRRALLSMD